MTKEEFDALNLKKGDQVSVAFYDKGPKPKLFNTGNVEYNGEFKDKQYFNTNEWDSSFYMIWTRKIKSVNVIFRKE